MNNTAKRIVLIVAIALVGIFGYRYFQGSPSKDDLAEGPSLRKAPSNSNVDTEPSPKSGDSQPTVVAKPLLSVDDDPIGDLRLEGQAVDEDGDPVEGAVIILGSSPPKTTTSDKYGSFSFENLVGRRYPVYARSSDRVGGPVVVLLTIDSAPVLVRMQRGGGIEIEVYDDGDHPIAGATVTIPSLDSVTAQTDSDGKVTIDNLPPGGTLISATAPGYAKSSSAVIIPRSADAMSTQRLTLVSGVQVSGQVVDTSGDPVANAKIIAQDVSALFAVEDPKKDGVISDSSGHFTLPAVPSGSMRLRAIHDDFAPTSGESFSVGDVSVPGIMLIMKEGGTISGKIVTSDGAASPWATLRVSGGLTQQGTTVNRQLIAGDDGQFTLRGLPKRELLLHASSKTAASSVVEVNLRAKANIKDLEIVLDVGGTISGLVVDDEGKPIAEVQVQATPDFWDGADIKQMQATGPAFATTDGDGAFVLHGLAESNFQLRASRSLVDQSAWLNKTTKAKTGDSGIRIILATPGSIIGSIQSSNGTIPEVAVASIGRGASAMAKKGRFQLSDVPPGTYELTLQGPEFASKYISKIEVKSGEVSDLGTISVDKGRTVRGQVVNTTGTPVSGAEVILAERIISDGKHLTPQSMGDSVTSQAQLHRAITDESGNFTLTGLGQKDWTIVADHLDSGRSAAASVGKGNEDVQVTLTLLEVGSVRGTIRVNGEGSANVSVLLATPENAGHILVVNSAPDGTFLIDRAAAGDYKLSAMLGSGASATMTATNLTVLGGQEIEANLDIEEGSVTFVVTIEGENNAPIDAAQIFLFRDSVDLKTGAELNTLFLSAASSAKMTFAMGTAPASFENINAGLISVCVIPINGDMNDPAFAQKLQRHVPEIAVYCHNVTIDSSPKTQDYTALVPPMKPLPED